MRIKICGITNLEDALFACQCGADALGFIFYEPSARFIEPSKAETIIKQLPPFVKTVGLFVNEKSQKINEISAQTNIDIAQIHFDVEEHFLNEIKIPTLPVVRAKSKDDINKYANRYKIVDSFSQSYGGSGKRVHLEWFNNIDCSKIILAGGLNDENVTQSCEYGFYGVDVSSGVEAFKGKKDFMKVKQFIDNAKKC